MNMHVICCWCSYSVSICHVIVDLHGNRETKLSDHDGGSVARAPQVNWIYVV